MEQAWPSTPSQPSCPLVWLVACPALRGLGLPASPARPVNHRGLTHSLSKNTNYLMFAGTALIAVCTQSGLFPLNFELFEGKTWVFATLGPQGLVVSSIWEEELRC